jgi:hypothetical protein
MRVMKRRFHIPLIEPDRQISRIRLSDKTSRFCVQRHLQLKQADANKAAAAARDADLRPMLEALRDRPLREIAMELTNRNRLGIRGK